MMIVNGIIIEQASSFSPRLRFTCKLLQKSAYPIMYWHHSRRTHQTILPTMTQGQPFSEQRRQSQVSIIITLSLRCTPRFATILIGSSSLAIISAVQNNDADFCFSNPIQNRLVSLRRGEETIFGQSGHYIISIWHLRLAGEGWG